MKADCIKARVLSWYFVHDLRRMRKSGRLISAEETAVIETVESMFKRFDLPKGMTEKDFIFFFTSLVLMGVIKDRPKSKCLSNARFILRFVLSKDEIEAVEGDLLETYENNLRDLGRRRAEWLLYKQLSISLWPFVKRFLYKVGAIAWATQVVRRLIGG